MDGWTHGRTQCTCLHSLRLKFSAQDPIPLRVSEPQRLPVFRATLTSAMFSASSLLSACRRGTVAAAGRAGLGAGRRTLVNAASLAVKDVSLTKCQPLDGGKSVALGFSDGTHFQFSGLWLRDSCRDPSLVCEAAGERILEKIPFSTGGRGIVAEAKVASAEKLEVNWADEADVVSTYDAGFLRQYAEAVAKDLDDCYAKDGGKSHAASDRWRWLQPYQGFAGSKAPPTGDVDLWKNEGREAPPHFLPIISCPHPSRYPPIRRFPSLIPRSLPARRASRGRRPVPALGLQRAGELRRDEPRLPPGHRAPRRVHRGQRRPDAGEAERHGAQLRQQGPGRHAEGSRS